MASQYKIISAKADKAINKNKSYFADNKYVVIEVKKIGSRIRELKQAVHDTFPFPVYKESKENCRKIGQAGGKQYQEVLDTVKSVQWKIWTEQPIKEVDWDIAVNLITR